MKSMPLSFTEVTVGNGQKEKTLGLHERFPTQLQNLIEHQCLYKILIPQNAGTERKLLVIPDQRVYIILLSFSMVKNALTLLKKYLPCRALLSHPNSSSEKKSFTSN